MCCSFFVVVVLKRDLVVVVCVVGLVLSCFFVAPFPLLAVLKPNANVLRTTNRGVEKLSILYEKMDEEYGMSTANLILQLVCQHGIVKTHTFQVESTELIEGNKWAIVVVTPVCPLVLSRLTRLLLFSVCTSSILVLPRRPQQFFHASRVAARIVGSHSRCA